MVGFILIMIWMWRAGRRAGAERSWHLLQQWLGMLLAAFLLGMVGLAINDPGAGTGDLVRQGLVVTFFYGLAGGILGMIAWAITKPVQTTESQWPESQ